MNNEEECLKMRPILKGEYGNIKKFQKIRYLFLILLS